MSVFTSLGIIIISALIIISLKVVPGTFAHFYHYASGKYSTKKTSDQATFFILGAETLPAIIFVITNLFLSVFTFSDFDPKSPHFLNIISALLLFLSLVAFSAYFKKGSELFLSRKTAKALLENAKTAKTRSDAFTLGFFAGFPELLFTFPLYFLVLIAISETFLSPIFCSFVLLGFALLAVSPLFFLCAYFKNNNLADFIRLRLKNKAFFHLFIPLLYILLASIIIFFEVYS